MGNSVDYLVPVENEAREQGMRDMLQQILSPVFAALQQMMDHNNESFAQIAASMTVQSDRMDALEKQIRLATPVTPGQVRYINNEIRHRARELLGRLIRKSILVRYGIMALNELPRCEYSVVISQIGLYNDALAVRDIVKGLRRRAEENYGAST